MPPPPGAPTATTTMLLFVAKMFLKVLQSSLHHAAAETMMQHRDLECLHAERAKWAAEQVQAAALVARHNQDRVARYCDPVASRARDGLRRNQHHTRPHRAIRQRVLALRRTRLPVKECFN